MLQVWKCINQRVQNEATFGAVEAFPQGGWTKKADHNSYSLENKVAFSISLHHQSPPPSHLQPEALTRASFLYTAMMEPINEQDSVISECIVFHKFS